MPSSFTVRGKSLWTSRRSGRRSRRKRIVWRVPTKASPMCPLIYEFIRQMVSRRTDSSHSRYRSRSPNESEVVKERRALSRGLNVSLARNSGFSVSRPGPARAGRGLFIALTGRPPPPRRALDAFGSGARGRLPVGHCPQRCTTDSETFRRPDTLTHNSPEYLEWNLV